MHNNHYRHWDAPSNAEFLQKVDPNKSIYLWAPEEAEGIDTDLILGCLKKTKKKIFIIYGCYGREHLLQSPWYKYVGKKISIRLWPSFMFYYTLQHIPYIKKDHLKYKKNYLFINLNNRVKYHRCLMVDLLEKSNLLKNNIFTWRNEESWLLDYNFQYWTPIPTKWPEVDFESVRDEDFPMAFPTISQECLFVLASESAVDMEFFTEKTLMPIFLGMPFLVYGCKGIHTHLKQLGFQLLDFVDYSFDKETDNDIRCAKIVKELERLSMIPLHELKKRTKKVCKFNQTHAYKLVKAHAYKLVKGKPNLIIPFPKYYKQFIKTAKRNCF